MFPPVVVDTNVVVAGLLTARADSPVARVLDGMLTAAFPFAVSEALLAEYRAVLRRPSLRKAHGLTLNELDIIVVELAQHGIVLAPVPAPPAPEPGPGGRHLWELLAARGELGLVTGDRRLQRDRAMGSRILSPATFVERRLSSRP
jgi:predicted nucleic acid-binding protein